MEPITTATTFIVSKFYYGISALFMGMVVMFLRKSPNLRGHGKAASGAIVGGVSVGSGVIFGGAIAVYFGMNPNDANTALAVGGTIGLFAVGIITAVANLLDKSEDKDIIELVQEAKAVVSKPPAKKVATKRVRAGTK